MRKLGRKEFIGFMMAIIGLAALWLLKRGVSLDKGLKEKHKRVYCPDVHDGIKQIRGVIFTFSGNRLRAYEARCTHLGCSLNLRADGKIICPCHGSEYDNQGKVVKGPAKDKLVALPVVFDESKKLFYAEILVED